MTYTTRWKCLAAYCLLGPSFNLFGAEINFNTYPATSYGVDLGAATVLDSGATLQLTGNAWKKIAFPYTVTPSTVIELEFRSTQQGEIQGIGFDTDIYESTNANNLFQLYGTQGFGNSAYNDYSGDSWIRYVIPVGQFYTGSMLYLVFSNDHDSGTPNSNSSFRNVKIYEKSSVSPFGISSSGEAYGGYPTFMLHLASVGIKSLRLFPSWNGIEPANGSFNFGSSDAFVNTATSHGIEIHGIFCYSPVWIAPTQKVFPMSNLPDWTDYVQRTTSHFSNDVRYWEVWNEPNASAFNQGNNSAADYATLLATAYNAAKAGNPDSQIGLTIANFDLRYISQVLQSGGATKFDYLCIHPYELVGRMDAQNGEIYYLNAVNNVRKMLAVHAPEKLNVPIWFSELGSKLGTTPEGLAVTGTTAANLLVKAYVMGIAQGAECIEWFEVKDAGGSQNYGILDDDFSQRPAYTACETMVTYAGPFPKYKGWLALGAGGKGFGFVFQGTNANIMAAWAPTGETAQVSFITTVQIVNPITNTMTGLSAGQTLTLTNSPVFIVNLPPSVVNQAQTNKHQPFPWKSSPVDTNLARIDYSASPVSQGIVQDKVHTTSPHQFADGVKGIKVNATPFFPAYFNADPSFADFNTSDVYIRVTARRINTSAKSCGMNLFYQPKNGSATSAPQYPYKNAGFWFGLPNNLSTHTFTWHLTDAMFVNTFGYSFYFQFDSSDPFVVTKVEVSKIPF